MIGAAVAFLFSPLGKIAVIAVAALSFVTYVDRRATYRERAKCQEAALRAELEAARRDQSAAEEQRRRAEETAAELEKAKTDAEQRETVLREEISKRPASQRCALTPDAARRMR